MGWGILGEVPPLLALPGGVLCLAGVALSRLPRRRARKPCPAEVALDTAAGG